jgi:hypothetical protein
MFVIRLFEAILHGLTVTFWKAFIMPRRRKQFLDRIRERNKDL